MGTVSKTRVPETRILGAQMPFEDLHEAGCYYSNWSGHLLRIPDDALKPGHSPVLEIRGNTPMFVTKLSDDPYLSISKARMIAADLDFEVNF